MLNVLIVGRKWFEKTNSNTYHTAEIFLNGEFIHKTKITYGYEDHYIHTGIQWLIDTGKLPPRQPDSEPDHRYFKRIGVKVEQAAVSVQRRKDL